MQSKKGSVPFGYKPQDVIDAIEKGKRPLWLKTRCKPQDVIDAIEKGKRPLWLKKGSVPFGFIDAIEKGNRPLWFSLWFALFVPFVSQKRRLSFQRRKSNTKTFHCQDCNSSVRVPPVKKAEPACSLRFIFTKPTPGQYHSWVTKGKSRQPVAGSA
jgi:hypothetical protein